MDEINKVIALIGLSYIGIREVYNIVCLIINYANGNIKKSDKKYKLVINKIVFSYVLFSIISYYIAVKLTFPQRALIITIIIIVIDLLTHYYLFEKDNMYLIGCTFKSDNIKKRKRYLILEDLLIKYYYEEKNKLKLKE